MENTEDRFFIESDKKSSELDKKVLSMIENGQKSELTAFLKENNLILRFPEWEIMNVIGTFNSDLRNKKGNLRVLKSLKKYGLSKAKIENDVLRLELRGKKSSAYPINEVFLNTDFLVDFYRRQGKCHDICLTFAEKVNVDCSVLTGFSYGLTNQSKYLHSVVKMQVGEFPRIIDTTMNAVLVEGFYKELLGFETLTEVPQSKIKEDWALLKANGDTNLKEYFLYRDECVKRLRERKDGQSQNGGIKRSITIENTNQKNKA